MAGRRKSHEEPEAAEAASADMPEVIDEGVSFEEALAEVEGIVGELESDQIPLERLIEQYEKGTRLLDVCRARIEAAEARVEIIARGRRGEKTLEPFEQDGGSGPAPEPPAARGEAPDADEPATPVAEEDDDGNDDIRLF